MNKKKFLMFPVLLALLFLCACGTDPAPTPTSEPTPEPTPEPVEYTITTESAQEILALTDIPSLKRIDGTASQEYAALLELYEARPDCEVLWNYTFDGQTYPNTLKELKAENLEGLEDALRYLPELTYVDILDTPATVEDLDRYSAIRPDIDYYWSFVFDGFTIRTDIQCYSTLRDVDYHRFTNEELYPMLKYCKHLKALDLGHNDLTDVSLIGELSELEVLILADNPIVDASPLGNLDKLIYLELFMCPEIEDFSFLNKLTNMLDLNLCYCDNLGNLDFLSNMPSITFLMVKYSGIEQEEIDCWQEQYPDTNFVLYDGNIHSCDSGWRDTQRNYQIRYAFTCWRHVEDYRHYDDVDFYFDGYIY